MRFPGPKGLYLFAAVLATGIHVWSWQQPFFWDTLLTSSVLQYWLTHGPGDLILPAALDAGHPPLFYLYLWTWLKVFGVQLGVAHAAMLPFLLSGLWAFLRLLHHFGFAPREQWTGLFLFLAIPAVATQYSLVSYDAVLLSLYLLALVFFLEDRRALFTLALLLLTGITARGIFAVAAVATTGLVLNGSRLQRWIPCFVPAGLMALGWYIYHQYMTGYVFAPDNGWSDHRGLADAGQIIRNLLSIARTMADLGLIVLFALNAYIVFRHPGMSIRYRVWLIPFLLFSAAFVFLTNPVNHRYYLVVYVLMTLPVLKWLSAQPAAMAVLVVLLLAAGHLQIYPGGISNGWDCTLSHLPYHSLKIEMLRYADANGIDRSRAGTVFPMNTSPRQDNFGADTVRMVNVNGGAVDSLRFVLYSNVGNDFSDAQLETLKSWKVSYRQHSGLVEMAWLENPRVWD